LSELFDLLGELGALALKFAPPLGTLLQTRTQQNGYRFDGLGQSGAQRRGSHGNRDTELTQQAPQLIGQLFALLLQELTHPVQRE